ncbi:outer membrane protein [Shigella sonnei]|nr:outer membrane protein [Shigella sonnei]
MLSREDFYMIKQMRQQGAYIVDIATQIGCSERTVRRYLKYPEPPARKTTSFSYAGDKNRQLTRYSDTRWHEDSVRNRWFSVMAGPSVRVNEWFSAYAMAGVAYSRVSTFSGDYLRVTDNKGKTHDVLTGSDDGRHSNTSLAH